MLKTIYVVFKTHFDIGFTGLPSEVIDTYKGSMLNDVLETCEATASNPEGHKYVWTMSSWPIKGMYLGASPEPHISPQGAGN